MKHSQTVKIQEYLANGGKITPLEALRKFGSLRLGARIKQLRDYGFNIKTEIVTRNGKRVAEYSMID